MSDGARGGRVTAVPSSSQNHFSSQNRCASATDTWLVTVVAHGNNVAVPASVRRGRLHRRGLDEQRGVATALEAALAHTQLHPRPTAVYFGSAADVRPVLDLPSYSWVFITPEPRHPVAMESYPKGTCGRCLGHTHRWHFFSMFLDRLGRREWVGTPSPFEGEDTLWYFARRDGSDLLRVYVNTTVESVAESPSAAAACADATAVYVMGFCPDVEAFKRACPRVKHVWGPRHEWMGLERYASRCDHLLDLCCQPPLRRACFQPCFSNQLSFFVNPPTHELEV